jgi:hypothetical protein
LNHFYKNSQKDFSTLKEYLLNYSFFKFDWPNYFDENDKLEQVDSIKANIEQVDLAGEKFISIFDYYAKFESHLDIQKQFEQNVNIKSLPEKHAKSESARVNKII